MEAVGITTTGHYTSGKFVYDNDLAVLYDVVLVLHHKSVGLKGGDDTVLDLHILGVSQVIYAEEVLGFLYAVLGKGDDFILFIYDIVTGLLLHISEDHIKLAHILHIGAAMELFCEDIRHLVDAGGLGALTGNNERGSCFINQDGVHLVDDGVVKIP